MPYRKIGEYQVEWPLSNKLADWKQEEVSALEEMEFDKGEFGGLSIRRSYTDNNPIQNIDEDYLTRTPGNLFYKKATKGSITISLTDVSQEGGYDGFRYTTPSYWVQRVMFRILKVNNGVSDGFVVFCEIENDEDDKDEAVLLLPTFDDVKSVLSKSVKNIQEDWFAKVEKLIA